MSDGQPLDAIGIGAGPSNLSLAALADRPGMPRLALFERRARIEWHPGLLLPGSELQVSHLKDLVTLVDPTSRHSFLNFLAETGRIHRFIVTSRQNVTRREFTQYYQWAASRLASVRLDAPVQEVTYSPDTGFAVRLARRTHHAPAIVLGTGRRPRVPAAARRHLGREALHAAEFLDRRPRTADRRVLVIGGGQSGAELVAHLLSSDAERPASLVWTSRRPGFPPLDDSPFANEWFNPRYVEYFHALPAARRHELAADQRLASDGVSESLLERIYRRLYELDFVERAPFAHRLLPGHEFVDMAGPRRVVLRNLDTGAVETVDADVVVFATGFEPALPDCVAPLAPLIATGLDDGLDADYRLRWPGAPGHAIFVQNGGRLSHGVADPNLSLASWRAARILNAICGRTVLRTDDASAAIAWPATARPVALEALS